MASVSKLVLVEHSAEQMFDLVERVEDYPEFLPWCGGTAILERTPTAVLARIDINYHGVRAHFTTANRNERPERIVCVILGALCYRWGVMGPALWVLALFATLTVIHRIRYTYLETERRKVLARAK